MLVISSREFRDNQAEYMDRADKGEQIIVHRGRNKAYAITPVKKSDIYISEQVIAKDFISADEVKERVHQHIDQLFSK